MSNLANAAFLAGFENFIDPIVTLSLPDVSQLKKGKYRMLLKDRWFEDDKKQHITFVDKDAVHRLHNVDPISKQPLQPIPDGYNGCFIYLAAVAIGIRNGDIAKNGTYRKQTGDEVEQVDVFAGCAKTSETRKELIAYGDKILSMLTDGTLQLTKPEFYLLAELPGFNLGSMEDAKCLSRYRDGKKYDPKTLHEQIENLSRIDSLDKKSNSGIAVPAGRRVAANSSTPRIVRVNLDRATKRRANAPIPVPNIARDLTSATTVSLIDRPSTSKSVTISTEKSSDPPVSAAVEIPAVTDIPSAPVAVEIPLEDTEIGDVSRPVLSAEELSRLSYEQQLQYAMDESFRLHQEENSIEPSEQTLEQQFKKELEYAKELSLKSLQEKEDNMVDAAVELSLEDDCEESFNRELEEAIELSLQKCSALEKEEEMMDEAIQNSIKDEIEREMFEEAIKKSLENDEVVVDSIADEQASLESLSFAIKEQLRMSEDEVEVSDNDDAVREALELSKALQLSLGASKTPKTTGSHKKEITGLSQRDAQQPKPKPEKKKRESHDFGEEHFKVALNFAQEVARVFCPGLADVMQEITGEKQKKKPSSDPFKDICGAALKAAPLLFSALAADDTAKPRKRSRSKSRRAAAPVA